MCGISGVFAYSTTAADVNAGALARITDEMKARGPDGHGLWLSPDRRVGLGHRRLAIIDITDAGAQPMSTADGALTITFNGEIYNYKELRRELELQGVAFRTHSDTEVLLHLYRRDGAEMVRRLRGMFAFAIWDRAARRLFMARDRYGIKPLYYVDSGGAVFFASQVRALRAVGLGGNVDPAGIVGFLLWGSVPEPMTMYESIRLLPAGSTLTVSGDGPADVSTYWRVETALRDSLRNADTVPLGSESEYVRTALVDSVRAHMVADVPVGAFLSAGMDSSAIVGLARKIAGTRIKTITISFEEFRNHPLDEVPLASEIASFLGVEHETIRYSMQDVERDLPRFFAAMDQPTIDGINTWLVSNAAVAAGLKVALSGLGGDELLGSYQTFRRIPEILDQAHHGRVPVSLGRGYRRVHSWLSRHVSRLVTADAGLFELGGSAVGAYQLCRGIFMPWELEDVLAPDIVAAGLERLGRFAPKPELDSLPPFATVSALESSRYMRNQLLRDSDWTSMSQSLEIRVPLVDHQLTASVAGLAATGRLGVAKTVLPAALDPPLPEHIVNKPKTGFTVPIWRWLRQSPHLDAWKRNESLGRRNAHDYKRLAYVALWRIDAVRPFMR